MVGRARRRERRAKACDPVAWELSRAAVTLARRTLLRGALAAVAAAALPGCAPRARRRDATSLDAAPVPTTMPFERIAYGAAPQQFADLRRPTGVAAPPLVIVLHGGFWQAPYDVGLMVRACEALARDGFATWNVAYRRLGDAGGGWPGTFLDVAAAADQLRVVAPRHGLDARRVVTLGHSAGGHLALWLAGRRWIRDGELKRARPLKVRGVLGLAAISDLRRAFDLGIDGVSRLMGGAPATVPERYATGDPAALLPLAVPQVLVHGAADRVVPVAMSEDYRREAKGRGDTVELVALPGVGHAEPIDPATPAWSAVVDGLRSLLA